MAELTAVLLAAGRGTRMKRTGRRTGKCLLRVGGETLLRRQLRQVRSLGAQQAVLVLGYRQHDIRREIGGDFAGMPVHYVVNADYAVTNNSYSLQCARRYLHGGVLIVETDVIMDETVIERFRRRLVATAGRQSYWLGDRFTPAHDGCCLRTGRDGRLEALRIVRERLTAADCRGAWKSTGIVYLAPETTRVFRPCLARAMRTAANRQRYYDLIIGDHLAALDLQVFPVRGARWMEVDNQADLRRARQLFARRADGTGNAG